MGEAELTHEQAGGYTQAQAKLVYAFEQDLSRVPAANPDAVDDGDEADPYSLVAVNDLERRKKKKKKKKGGEDESGLLGIGWLTQFGSALASAVGLGDDGKAEAEAKAQREASVAACRALNIVCAGHDEAALQRTEAAIDLHARAQAYSHVCASQMCAYVHARSGGGHRSARPRGTGRLEPQEPRPP